MKNRLLTWTYWYDEWIKPLVFAVIIAMIIRTFIVQPFKIPSTSMYPTLQVGDRIFVNKFIFGAKVPFIDNHLPKLREPKRGDVIVFISVTDPAFPEPENDYIRIVGPVFVNKKTKFPKWYASRYIVKRLIGLPGDKVSIKDGDVLINGKTLEQPAVIKNFSYYNAGDLGKEGSSIVVPEDSYFVLGDNSANSVDSRFWGFVPREKIEGKVFVIWWPLKRIMLVR